MVNNTAQCPDVLLLPEKIFYKALCDKQEGKNGIAFAG